MIKQKSLMVLESAFPFVFFTKTFSEPLGFRNAEVEYYNNGLEPQEDRNRLLSEPCQTAEQFLRSIFQSDSQLDFFLNELTRNGETEQMEIDVTSGFSETRRCLASGKITRLGEGEYFFQGMLVARHATGKNEGSLFENDRMLEAILMGIGDAVCIYDSNLKVLFQTPLHKKWFGNPIPYMLFNRYGSSGRLQGERRTIKFTKTIRNSHGKPLHLEVSCIPVKNETGEVFAGINVVHDRSLSIELEAKSRELDRIKQDQEQEVAFRKIIGKSRPVKKILQAVKKISQLDTAVYIQGDTGTGKELIANAIHNLSPRCDKPFLAVNCGALTGTLLDSELFGHTRGSFTGADSETTGLFEAANGGTIFLDEIGEMSMETQVKLLRVLQDGEIRKLGSTRNKKVDVRIITATHRDIEALVTQKKFREDLFYRIHVFTIHTPTLKERGDDILLLADHFLHYFSKAQNKRIRTISKDAALIFKAYSWPGNVRELRNAVERAVILCETDTLQAQDLPISLLQNGSGRKPDTDCSESNSPEDDFEDLSKRKILACLEKNRWNKTLTAKDLNISRATLWRKIKELSLTDS